MKARFLLIIITLISSSAVLANSYTDAATWKKLTGEELKSPVPVVEPIITPIPQKTETPTTIKPTQSNSPKDNSLLFFLLFSD